MPTRRDFLKAAGLTGIAGSVPSAFPAAAPSVDNWNHALRALRARCLAGLGARCPHCHRLRSCHWRSKPLLDRLDHELRTIDDQGATDRFLVYADLGRFACARGIPMLARGSAPGSLVVHALGLSLVCPLEHGLLFERFVATAQDGSTRIPAICLDVSVEDFETLVAHLSQGRDLHYLRAARQDLDSLPYDLLGLRVLSLVKKTAKITGHEAPIDLNRIPDGDDKTLALFQRGDTAQFYQFRSKVMQEFLRHLRPQNLTDLTAAIALYRPGPLECGLAEALLNRRRGLGSTHGAVAPPLDDILSGTYGVLVFQEQLMEILHRLGGVALADGYQFIKDLCKQRHEAISKQRQEFLCGARQRGHHEQASKQTFDLIERSGPQTFCKAHALAYASLAYHAAYFKAHYPAEFEEAARLTDRLPLSKALSREPD